MNIKKPNSFARYGDNYVAPLTTIDQIVKPSGERYTDKEFELMSNVENVMFGENSAGKNLLRPTLQTTTKNGVTCTNNGDGTYTLNGTASAKTEFILSTNVFNAKRFVGCPSGGSDSTYRCEVRKTDNQWLLDTGDGVSYDNGFNYLKLVIFSGYTCNNLVFKPMITDDLSATYDDFEPYVKSLKQLTNSALNMDLLWTNASPTSQFSPQNIDLSQYVNSYKFFILQYAIAMGFSGPRFVLKELTIGTKENFSIMLTSSY